MRTHKVSFRHACELLVKEHPALAASISPSLPAPKLSAGKLRAAQSFSLTEGDQALLDQVIDGQALLIEARKNGLDKDPVVSRQMTDASDRALQSALIGREVGPTLSEAAIRARYDRDIAGKPGEEEVHARHILVADEAEAKKIIAELKKGGDFAALAKKYSTDPGGAQGGDLGFFRKEEMVPEFAEAAFAMKPGEISTVPVHTQFGWHVIKLEERRTAPPPSFEQSHDQLRQKLIQEGVQAVIAKARADVKIERFNMDGSVLLELFSHDGVGTMITYENLESLREATIDDIGGIIELIEPLEADGTLVKRGRELIEREISNFSVIEHDNVIFGCAALYPFPAENMAEMACLTVAPEVQTQGDGERILKHMEKRARRAGLSKLFVLTTRTAHWFLKRGFVAAPVDDLPKDRQRMYNWQRKSIVLIKQL